MKTLSTRILVSSSLAIALGMTSLLASARPGVHPGEHRPLLQELDLNDDGEISTAEIESATASRAQETDTDGDGLISADEVAAMHERKRQERIAMRLGKADTNGDGSVSLAEFADQHTAMALRLDRNGDGVIRADEMRRPRAAQGAPSQRPHKP